MIKFEWRTKPEKPGDPIVGRVYVDGVAINTPVERKEPLVYTDLSDTEASRIFLGQNASDFPPYCYWILQPFAALNWWAGDSNVSFDRRFNDGAAIRVKLYPALADWDRPWSFLVYRKELVRIVDELNPFSAALKVDGDQVEVCYTCIISPSDRLEKLIDLCEVLRIAHEQAERNLAAQIRPDSVVTYFDFPPQAKTACGQYLLYFAQFLADLGVTADCELKEEMGKVLFAVTPTTAEDALGKIRAVLAVYLRLPTSPIAKNPGDGLQVQSMIAQIHHLKGQLAVASAVRQAKDAIIEAQRTTISVLTGDIVVDSVRLTNAPINETNEEQFLDGMVSLTKYEGKAFKVDLPEVFRRLKKLFQQE